MNKIFNVVAFSLLATVATAQETIRLKPDAKEGKDANIFAMQDAIVKHDNLYPYITNYGADGNMLYSTWTYSGNTGTHRILIAFEELSKISKKAIILNAELKLYGVADDGWAGNSADNNHGKLYRITQKWSEDKVTWKNQPAIDDNKYANLPATQEAWNEDITVNVTDLVQEIVSKKEKNYGWMLRLNQEQTYRRVRFASSDHADSTRWPELVVTYTTSKEIAGSIKKQGGPTVPTIAEQRTESAAGYFVGKEERVAAADDPGLSREPTMEQAPQATTKLGYSGPGINAYDVSTSACNSNRSQLGTSRYYQVTNNSDGNFYRYGVEDAERNQVLPVIYSSISTFNKNYYRLGFGALYGIYDKDFKEVLPIEYTNIVPVTGYDYFIVSKNNTSKLVDKKGENIYPQEPYRSVENMAYYDESTNTGGVKYVRMYDLNGSFLFDLDKKKRVTPSSNGYYEYNRDIDALIYRNNATNNREAYLLDMNLKVKGSKFEEIQEIKNGKAVAKNGKFGLIDQEGKASIPFEYDAMQRVYSNLTAFVVKKNGKYGVINEQKKELIPMAYDSIFYYNENCIMVMQNKLWGMMDILGQEKVKPQFNGILMNQNYNNTTVLGMNSSGAKIVDVSGQTLKTLNVDKAYVPDNGYGFYTTEKSGKLGIMSTTFQELIPAKYESLAMANYNAKIFVAKLNKKFGVLAFDGSELLKFDYDDISTTNTDVLIVRKGSKYGAFSLGSNKLVVPIEYDNIAPQNSYSDKKIYYLFKDNELTQRSIY